MILLQFRPMDSPIFIGIYLGPFEVINQYSWHFDPLFPVFTLIMSSFTHLRLYLSNNRHCFLEYRALDFILSYDISRKQHWFPRQRITIIHRRMLRCVAGKKNRQVIVCVYVKKGVMDQR